MRSGQIRCARVWFGKARVGAETRILLIKVVRFFVDTNFQKTLLHCWPYSDPIKVFSESVGKFKALIVKIRSK